MRLKPHLRYQAGVWWCWTYEGDAPVAFAPSFEEAWAIWHAGQCES